MIQTDLTEKELRFAIRSAEATVLRAPILEPVKTAFGVMHDRPAVFLRVRDKEGNAGFGEVWCNFPVCGAEHRRDLLATTIFPELLSRAFESPQACFRQLENRFRRLAIQTGEHGPIAQCIAGIDIALWDLVARRAGKPLFEVLGGSDNSIGTYASGINPAGAMETVERCRAEGHVAFKLKIGFGDEIDRRNIDDIARALVPGEALMVDANQAWLFEEALKQVAFLTGYSVSWLEEPMIADVPDEQWQKLADACAIPLAGGENIAGLERFASIIDAAYFGVIQPDLCKWGGFSGNIPVAKRALKTGRRLCPHYLGGGIGLAASAHFLAAVGGDGILEIDCNPNPLRERLFSPVVSAGRIRIPATGGIGLPTEDILDLVSSKFAVRT